MRRRATFITDASTPLDPNVIKLEGRALSCSGIQGAREEKLTFAFDELPITLVDVLKQSHELHIRWTSGISYKSLAPFVSHSIPGLHVHYTPLHQHQHDLLCQTLRSIFSNELKCDSANSTFTRPSLISERFTTSTALQYYSPLRQLASLIAYIQRKICPQSDLKCIQTATLLSSADYFDIDFDSISHTLVVTVFWSRPPKAQMDMAAKAIARNQWMLNITAKPNDKVEVGFLTQSESIDAHDIQMQGLLVEVGESESPKPVMFSFPSRHHSLSSEQSAAQVYNVSFVEPTGLHPILEIKFASARDLVPPTSKPEDSTCALHAYFTLPSAIFADQYAFPTTSADPLFEAAHGIKYLRSISDELDLEAPDYVIDKWGSAMLLELSTPSVSSDPSASSKNQQVEKDPWSVTVPLHLRYLPPSKSQSHIPITVPWPVVFWACTAEEGTKFPVNPFDRIHLGYDTLFGPRTMFYNLDGSRHLALALSKDRAVRPSQLISSINVPVLNTRVIGGDHVVQFGTLIVVVLGFLWVVAQLMPAFISSDASLVAKSGAKSTADQKGNNLKPGSATKKKQ